MGFPWPLRCAALVLGLTGAAQAAWAQSAACARYRAELAALGRGGGSTGSAQRQAREIARLAEYAQAIGCGGGQSFFGGPPRECGAIMQRIGMMHANYRRLVAEDSVTGSARRQRLRAAVREACDPQREGAAALREASEESGAKPPRGSGRLVCVRTCDGYFFPLHNLPQRGRSGPDAMCQALCPAAETAAYRIPGGLDGDIADAVSLRGKPYARLANAFRYQKAVDQSCSCRQPGQSWVEALNKAERMIGRERGDIIVTAAKAEELSRPRLGRKAEKRLQQARKAPPLDVETTGSIAPSKSPADAQAAMMAPAREASSGTEPQRLTDHAIAQAPTTGAATDDTQSQPAQHPIGVSTSDLPWAAQPTAP
jgi:hypothetical protein